MADFMFDINQNSKKSMPDVWNEGSLLNFSKKSHIKKNCKTVNPTLHHPVKKTRYIIWSWNIRILYEAVAAETWRNVREGVVSGLVAPCIDLPLPRTPGLVARGPRSRHTPVHTGLHRQRVLPPASPLAPGY